MPTNTTNSAFPVTRPYQENYRPGFVGDFLNREHVLPGGIKLDASTFNGDDAITAVVGSAGAAANATSVPVAALAGTNFNTSGPTVLIPAETVLTFGAGSAKKYARLSADALAGDIALIVYALPTALVSGDTAYYTPISRDSFGRLGAVKRVAAGTPVYATQANVESSSVAATGLLWKYAGPGVSVGGTDVVRVLAYDVQDVVNNNDAEVLRRGTLLKVNHMYWSTLDSSVQAAIRAAYEITVGAPGQEVSF